MKLLRNLLDKPRHLFEEGGRLHKFYALYEMADTFLYTPADTTRSASHIRDAINLKRIMITVAFALTPVILFALYNTGYQTNLALARQQMAAVGWRAELVQALGFGFDPASIAGNMLHGLTYFLPIFLVTNLVGGFWEALFAVVRKHEINEGFLVTGLLFPLILPPTIPLWQVAIGISFAVVFGKEVFGGTGMNVFNPALLGRAFLFFAYPGNMSGIAVWVPIDGFSSATALGVVKEQGMSALLASYSWQDAFLGLVPGSMGETSALACLIGAAVLLITGIASWQIMASIVLSAGFFATLFNFMGSSTNPMFAVPAYWHFVLGGFAFGTVFMATDPVSAAMTSTGKYLYGALIGFMVILIRVINPGFPEGMMLAILFGNAFAPIMDSFVVKANIKRRAARHVN